MTACLRGEADGTKPQEWFFHYIMAPARYVDVMLEELSNHSAPPNQSPAGWPELLALALVLTIAAHAVPVWLFHWLPAGFLSWRFQSRYVQWSYDCLALALAALLAVPTPHRSGIRVGRFSQHRWTVLAIMAVPILLTAMIYPRLQTRPFAGMSASMWVVSPLAQDLLFIGYLYGRFEPLVSRPLVRRVPVNFALIITALFFAAWHLPNLRAMPAGYVMFQLVYVFVGFIWTGMTRLLTGSILYSVLVHMAVNAIAWYVK